MSVMYAQLSEPPPALSSRRRGLPFAVDGVFIKALAKAPADRYGTCSEFAEALRLAFGLRPYDSGPGAVPSGGHPATRIVRPSDPAASVPSAAGTGFAGTGAAGTGAAAPGAAAPGAAAPGAATPGAAAPGAATPGAAAAGAAAPGAAGAAGAAEGYPRQNSGQAGYQGPTPTSYPGPGYAGQDEPRTPAVPGGPPDQGGSQPTGVGSGGGGRSSGAQTPAAAGTQTAPDLTAPHLQHGRGGHGQYGGPDVQANIARPWWKSPLALVAAVVVLLGGGAAAYALTKGGGGGADGGASGGATNVVALKPPGCSTMAAHGKKLAVKTPFVPVSTADGKPFGIAASHDGKAVFVTTDTSLRVFRTGPGGALTAGPTYPVGSPGSAGLAATVVTVTPDRRYVLVAAGHGIRVFDLHEAEVGGSNGELGRLRVQGVGPVDRAVKI